jgi:hypothetical protein
MKKLLVLLIALCSLSPAIAQEKKDAPDLKQEVVIGGKRFKVYNNWLSGGGGAGYNTQVPQLQFIGDVNFNFHIKGNYFQTGLILSGDAFGNYNNTVYHAGYGKRKENEKYNFAAFGGISYTRGYRKIDRETYNIDKPYKVPGLYIDAQAIRKVSYDVGIGIALTADVNSVRTLAGVVGTLYFSGAYKGKKY